MSVLKKILQAIVAFSTTAFAMSVVLQVHAETMSSTNYTIQTDVISIGGGASASAGYAAEDSLGDVATGENLTSANYVACAGFECFQGQPFVSFSVREGTSAPGAIGAGVALGTLTTGTVTTSNGTSLNSIFVTAESNASGGVIVSARDENAGLKRISTSDTITSASATLVAGTEGYGICVFSATQGPGSPSAFSEVSPYDGTCTKTTGHAVGALTTTPQVILQSSEEVMDGSAEILVKAAISTMTVAGNDYADTITFIATSTF